jgi:CRP-like cAMP-binding protein
MNVQDAMYIVITGSVSTEKWRGAKNQRVPAGRRGEQSRCKIGSTFGESSLTAATDFARRRTSAVRAHEPTILATLSRDHYLRITRTGELQKHIDLYWEMIMNDAFGDDRDTSETHHLCEVQMYKKLHRAIAKTLHQDWDRNELEEQVDRDWHNDIARHNMGNAVLNHRQFSDALFELVDEFCGTISTEMFVKFLDTVYRNIRCTP